jgi:hypothetical protein
MKAFEIIRDSGPASFTTALLTALLMTSATVLPFLIQGAVANPVPAALPHPQPHAFPAPQPHPQGTGPPLVGFYPEPERCLGNCSGIHDPSIWYEDGTYWRFSTSGNIAIATAPSIGGPWRYQGALLHDGTSIYITDDQDVWVSFLLHVFLYNLPLMTPPRHHPYPNAETHTTASTPSRVSVCKTPASALQHRYPSPPVPGLTTAP